MCKFNVALALSFILAGCGPEGYRAYGTPTQPLAEAQRDCEAKARAAFPSKTYIPEFKILQDRQDLVDACMTEKNWRPARS